MTSAPAATPAIVILAAGSSARMGARDKLMEPVDGQPLIARTARRAVATGAPVIVVLPPDRPQRLAALAGLPVTIVTAEDAQMGMAASLRRGIAALPKGVAGAMILPADMPEITTEDLTEMLLRFAADPTRILRGATSAGRAGHPAIFPADLFAALAALSGDTGGRSVIQRNEARVTLVVLPGDAAVRDLDTPEDWATWRASRRQ